MTNPPCYPTREGDPPSWFTCLQSMISIAAKRARNLVCFPLLVLPLAAQNVSRLTLQESTDLQDWQPVPLTPEMLDSNGKILVPTDTATRFYRMQVDILTPPPITDEFALIPAGSFEMGDQSNPSVGVPAELPVHSVHVSGFYMAKYETTKELWDDVRDWGTIHGYTDLPAGNGSYASKGANHPVHSINWYAMVKWCNARSEKENLTPCYTVSGSTYKTGGVTPVCNWNANGYRLPTETEWEKAARGGLCARNFPWGNTISHDLANFWNGGGESYQSGTTGPHPTYAVDGYPYSSPVGSFAPNGYGLHDMAGNMWEWCWDLYADYTSASQTDPRGATSGWMRVFRGGSWETGADGCRVAARNHYYPTHAFFNVGFRIARSSVP